MADARRQLRSGTVALGGMGLLAVALTAGVVARNSRPSTVGSTFATTARARRNCWSTTPTPLRCRPDPVRKGLRLSGVGPAARLRRQPRGPRRLDRRGRVRGSRHPGVLRPGHGRVRPLPATHRPLRGVGKRVAGPRPAASASPSTTPPGCWSGPGAPTSTRSPASPTPCLTDGTSRRHRPSTSDLHTPSPVTTTTGGGVEVRALRASAAAMSASVVVTGPPRGSLPSLPVVLPVVARMVDAGPSSSDAPGRLTGRP